MRNEPMDLLAANEAIASVVACAAKIHPALKLDASMFKLAFRD